MTMLIYISRLVAGMIVMLARNFFLAGLVAVAVLIGISRLMVGMIVMWAKLLLRHGILLC